MHALQVRSNLVILSMAWMTGENAREFTRMPNEPDLETLTYWVTRLEPLIRAENTGEIIVVFANRCGIEGNATYAGTSAVLGIEDGEVSVYGLLGRGEKELLVVDTSHAPYGKLQYNPEHLRTPHPLTSQVRRPFVDETQTGYQAHAPSANLADMGHGLPQHDHLQVVDRSPEPVVEQAVEQEQTSDSAETPTIASDAIAEPEAAPASDAAVSNTAPEPPAADRTDQLTAGIGGISIRKETRNTDYARYFRSNSTNNDAEDENATPIESEESPYSPRAAVRPKLVIPSPPTMAPQQLYPDQPTSAASAISERSIHSIKSMASEASTATIRSNHRPPEDSTPYPHSGLPLSGYPHGKQTYERFAAIGQEDEFPPITPFEDMTPASATGAWDWPRSATPLNSITNWPQQTSFGGYQEPVTWTSMRGLTRPRSQSTRRMNSGTAAVRRPTPPVPGWYQPPNWGQPATAFSEWKNVSKSIEMPEGVQEADSSRPASPKSRNASRSRGPERPASAMGKPDFSAAAQHLEYVNKRVSSLSRTRQRREHLASESYFDAESSPDSRGDSPAQPSRSSTSTGLGNDPAPIMANASFLGPEAQRQMMVPTPVAHDYYRSVSTNSKQFGSPALSSTGKRTRPRTKSRTQEDGIERSPSRGRGRDPKPSSSTPGRRYREDRMRSTSIDSTRNDILHRHVRRPSANGGSQLSRNHSRNTIHGGLQIPEGYTPDDFTRVEEVACPNCPVHGHRSSSASNSVSNLNSSQPLSLNRSPRRRRSTSSGLNTTPNPPVMREVPVLSQGLPAHVWQADPRPIPDPRFAPAPVQRRKKTYYHKSRRSLVVSPVQRPNTAPLPFDPPTPKAMAYIPATGEVRTPSDDEFSLPASFKGKYMDKGKGLGVALRVTA